MAFRCRSRWPLRPRRTKLSPRCPTAARSTCRWARRFGRRALACLKTDLASAGWSTWFLPDRNNRVRQTIKLNNQDRFMKLDVLIRFAALLFFAGDLIAAEPRAMPQPTKEHEWLKQFAGEWDVETEAFVAPDQPPM